MNEQSEIIDGLGVRNNTEVVYARLRETILRGELEPGVAISEAQIARQFDLSRGPVREAFRMLQREGLIEGKRNHRSRVAAFSVVELEGLYALRIINESFALRVTAPHFTTQDLATIDRLLKEMRSFEEVDYPSWERVHTQFHEQLYKYAGTRITNLIGELMDHSARYRQLYTHQPRSWSVGREEHYEIVAACSQQRPVDAARLLARHLARTALTVLALRAPEHDPALVRVALNSVAAGEAPQPQVSREPIPASALL